MYQLKVDLMTKRQWKLTLNKKEYCVSLKHKSLLGKLDIYVNEESVYSHDTGCMESGGVYQISLGEEPYFIEVSAGLLGWSYEIINAVYAKKKSQKFEFSFKTMKRVIWFEPLLMIFYFSGFLVFMGKYSSNMMVVSTWLALFTYSFQYYIFKKVILSDRVIKSSSLWSKKEYSWSDVKGYTLVVRDTIHISRLKIEMKDGHKVRFSELSLSTNVWVQKFLKKKLESLKLENKNVALEQASFLPEQSRKSKSVGYLSIFIGSALIIWNYYEVSIGFAKPHYRGVYVGVFFIVLGLLYRLFIRKPK